MFAARSLGLIALLSVALASPVVASDADAGEEAAERLICKKQKKTGTRFTTRTCMTARQWDELAERARREGKDIIDKASAQAQVSQNGPI